MIQKPSGQFSLLFMLGAKVTPVRLKCMGSCYEFLKDSVILLKPLQDILRYRRDARFSLGVEMRPWQVTG